MAALTSDLPSGPGAPHRRARPSSLSARVRASQVRPSRSRHATARLRPGGILDLTAASVLKKMKKKDFARNINRDDVARGAAEFGVPLEEHVQFEIDAMKTIAGELGLAGGDGSEVG